MTRAEQRTLEQVDQKLDDLADRFDRFISTLKWSVTALFVALGSVGTLIIALKH